MAPIQAAIDAILGSKTEIIIFLFAICFHSLIFGGHRPGAPAKGFKLAKGTKPAEKGGQDGSPRQPANCPHSAFVRIVSSFLRAERSLEELKLEISKQLELNAMGTNMEALEALLSTIGRSANTKVLAAVRGALQLQGLHPSVRLYELLLRGYLGLRLLDDFSGLLAEVESRGVATPSIKVLALRAAVQSSNWDAAIACVPGLASTLKSSSSATPSTAYALLVQKLVGLAAESAAMPRLLQELHACELLNQWVLEAVLEECYQRGDVEHLDRSVQLALSQGTVLTATARGILIRGARTAADALSHFEDSVGQAQPGAPLLVALAEAAGIFGDTVLASAVLKHLPANPTAALAVAVLRLCARGSPLAGQDEGVAAAQLFEQHFSSVDLSQDVKVQRLVVDAATKTGQIEVVRQLVTQLPDNASRAALLKTYASDRCLDGARRIFQACPDKDACLYNALLGACIACRDMAAAERSLAQASAMGAADIVTYNTMIKACAQLGDLRRARAFVRTMRSAGFEPNSVTFNELIDAAATKGGSSMWDVVDEMEACCLKPTRVTCSILLKSIQRNSQPRELERIVGIMERADTDQAMDEVLLSSLCEACIRTGRSDLLASHLQRQRGARGVPIKAAHTYGSLIRSYGFLCDLDGVWATWRQMRAGRIVPTCVTLGCMVEAITNNGEPEAGLALIHEMLADEETRSLVNAVIYCSVLKGFSHRKRFEQVWAVHEEMREKKLQYSIVTYNALIDACARSSEMSRVASLLEQMSCEGIEPNVITYSTVIKGYCQDNRIEKAFEVLEDMKRSADFSPDEVTYNTLLDGCARHGMLERGLALLKGMQDAGVTPSNFTLSVLVKLTNRSRRPDMAFELCSELSSKYNIRLNMHVYNNLVHACTAHGKLPRALEVFEKMLDERVRPDVRTYALLLRSCVSARATTEAEGLLRAAAGLGGAPSRFLRHGVAGAQPKGGLTAELVTEVLEGIAASCGEEQLAVQLLQDLRSVRGLKLDGRLSTRLTARAIRSTSGRW